MVTIHEDEPIKKRFLNCTTFDFAFSGAHLSVSIPQSRKHQRAVRMKNYGTMFRQFHAHARKRSQQVTIVLEEPPEVLSDDIVEASIKARANQFLAEHGSDLKKLKAQVEEAKSGFYWTDPAKAAALKIPSDKVAQLLGAQRL